MSATSSLMICVLAMAQPADRTEWTLQPRLAGGQELVYRGMFDEQSSGGEVQFTRGYRLQTVAFVLDAAPRGSDVAFLTVLRPRAARPGRVDDAAPNSVRLEVVRLDPQGRLSGEPGAALAVPLEGPPTVEVGAAVEFPRHRVGVGGNWSVAEDGRTPRAWTVAGTETLNAATCVKLVGVQKSDDWDQPRADRTAWRRQDTVWLAPRLGVAVRVERVVERRAPAHREAGYKSVLRYELDQRTDHVGGLGDDIRREIAEARKFADRAAPLLREPAKQLPQVDALINRIKYHQEHNPAPPPYGEAIAQLRRRLEAARRGDAAPQPAAPEREAPAVAVAGKVAPDFVVPDLVTGDSVRLTKWKSKPILMIFYTADSVYAETVLRLGQEVHDSSRGAVVVLGLAMSHDAEALRKQRADLRLAYPVLDGSGLRQSYAVEATPKLMVLDADGVVRGGYVGWGRETRAGVLEEVRGCLPRGK